MSEYKVTREFEVQGVVQPVGAIIELEEAVATPFIEAGDIVEVTDTPEDGEETVTEEGETPKAEDQA